MVQKCSPRKWFEARRLHGCFAIDEMKVQVTLKSKSVQLTYLVNYNIFGKKFVLHPFHIFL